MFLMELNWRDTSGEHFGTDDKELLKDWRSVSHTSMENMEIQSALLTQGKSSNCIVAAKCCYPTLPEVYSVLW